jgi:hypothetical protein
MEPAALSTSSTTQEGYMSTKAALSTLQTQTTIESSGMPQERRMQKSSLGLAQVAD